jgi:hypothetical protein
MNAASFEEVHVSTYVEGAMGCFRLVAVAQHAVVERPLRTLFAM